MVLQDKWNILLLAQENTFDIPEILGEFTINLTWIENIDTLLTGEFPTVPDLILVKDQNQRFQGGDLIFEIKKRWEPIPIVMIMNQSSIKTFQEIFASGGLDFIREQYFKEELLALIYKCQFYHKEKQENKFLVENLSDLIAYLQEKNAIFKTIVELITHDTKNQFYYIATIINQIKDKNLKEILENAIHELNECILETYGYLNGKKRICSAISMIENLRLEKNRIILKNHSRIRFTHVSNYILFIEVSALFKNSISNIIENALKYSPEENLVPVHLSRDEQFVIIEIADSGPGISDDNKKRIFEWNYRIEKDLIMDGSGKGLWITRNIIKKEMGTITVSDQSNGGTIFTIKVPAFKINNFKQGLEKLSSWFELPPLIIQHKVKVLQTFLSLQQIPSHYDMESIIFANLVQLLRDETVAKKKKYFYKKLIELKKLNPEGKSVLIIDDSIHVHYYLAAHLTNIGYKVSGFAGNGADGVSYYESLRPDLVTMDSTMPIMSGTEAAAEIVKINKNARILFVTGFGDHPRFIESVKQALPQENYKIIKKPFKKEELINILKDFC